MPSWVTFCWYIYSYVSYGLSHRIDLPGGSIIWDKLGIHKYIPLISKREQGDSPTPPPRRAAPPPSRPPRWRPPRQWALFSLLWATWCASDLPRWYNLDKGNYITYIRSDFGNNKHQQMILAYHSNNDYFKKLYFFMIYEIFEQP